jgi:hypothetical protein
MHYLLPSFFASNWLLLDRGFVVDLVGGGNWKRSDGRSETKRGPHEVLSETSNARVGRWSTNPGFINQKSIVMLGSSMPSVILDI